MREDFVFSNPLSTRVKTGARPSARPPRSILASQSARNRVTSALDDLGMGLQEAALRCCCLPEGLEKRLGWSARSSKIILRITLQRLVRHYAETQGKFAPRIG